MKKMTSFNYKKEISNYSGGTPTMVVMDIKVNNFLAFNDFHMNLAFNNNDEDSLIAPESFKDRPNFYYKKVAIINGSNASGKTTLGILLSSIFSFIDQRDISYLVAAIGDKTRNSYFSIDLIIEKYKIHRLEVKIEKSTHAIKLRVLKTLINDNDDYYTCSDRLNKENSDYTIDINLALDKLPQLHWMILPKEFNSYDWKTICKNQELFISVLDKVMRTLDPSIISVKEINSNICIDFGTKKAITVDGNFKEKYLLSTGTKEGITIALILSEVINNYYGFYYCDEKFSCIDSDIEISILIAMISNLAEGSQLFFTTHNKELLNLKLPVHSFYFLNKKLGDNGCSIRIANAEEILNSYKKPFCNTSLYDAVINDYFSTVPETNLITELTK